MPLRTTSDHRPHPYLSTVLDTTVHRVIATANARLYNAPLGKTDPNWKYSKIKGILVFGRDRSAGTSTASLSEGYSLSETYWFRLVDTATDRVVWMLRIPESFDYHQDKPVRLPSDEFLCPLTHLTTVFPCFLRKRKPLYTLRSFSATILRFRAECLVFALTMTVKPLLFTEKFKSGCLIHPVGILRRISHQLTDGNSTDGCRSFSVPKSLRRDKSRPKPAKPPKPVISAPSPASFVHVSHIGFNADGIIEASGNVDPSWEVLIKGLQGHGISREVVLQNLDFVEGFLAGSNVGKETTDVRSTLILPS